MNKTKYLFQVFLWNVKNIIFYLKTTKIELLPYSKLTKYANVYRFEFNRPVTLLKISLPNFEVRAIRAFKTPHPKYSIIKTFNPDHLITRTKEEALIDIANSRKHILK